MFYFLFVLANAIIGYLFGSLSWSIIIGKIFYKKDPRDYNSKNAGATNSLRVYGKKTALLVLILDIAKTIIPAICIWSITKYCFNYLLPTFPSNFSPFSIIYICPMFAILGHCFPIFFKFKGGKGAACFGAFLWLISPWIAIISLLIFIIFIKKSKMVSFAVLCTSLICPFLIFIPGINYFYILENDISKLFYFDYSSYFSLILLFIIMLLSIGLIFIKHRENIKRILSHSERKIEIKNKKI